MIHHSHCRLLVVLLLLSVIHTQSPEFLVHPASVAAVDGSTVEFTCTANNTDTIVYRVNDTSATLGSVTSKGFNPLDTEPLDTLVARRNLSVTVSSLYNNTEILCIAEGTLGINVNVYSNTATLTVQGPLSSVDGLSYSFRIDCSTINISWSPPFTLPGTRITGYNISVTTSNGTTTDYYTSNSYYVLLLTDITDSPCDQITITVSGYNGLNGEDEAISGPSSEPLIPLMVSVDQTNERYMGRLDLSIDLSEVIDCVDPLLNVTLMDDTLMNDTQGISVFNNIVNGIITLGDIFTVSEDQHYTVSVSLTIINGTYTVSNTTSFNTFGILSVTPSISGTRLSSISSITTSSSSNSSSVMSTIPTNLPTGTSSSKLDPAIIPSVAVVIIAVVIIAVVVIGCVVWKNRHRDKTVQLDSSIDTDSTKQCIPSEPNKYCDDNKKDEIATDNNEGNYAQVDHSGIAPFAPLRLQQTEYQDIDHMRTAAMKDTPPAVPPKMGGAHNTGFGNNNNTKDTFL